MRIALNLTSIYSQALPDPAEMPFRIVELDINSPAVDAVASSKVDIAIDSDYSQIPELLEEAQRLHITYIPIGRGANFLAMMAGNPLAQKADLQRADLDGTTVIVNSGAHLDRWSQVIKHLVGPNIRLSFKLNQTESYGDAALTDFENAIYICGSDSTRSILKRRRDVVVYDLLDGKPITFPTALICRTKDYLNKDQSVGKFIRTFLNNLQD